MAGSLEVAAAVFTWLNTAILLVFVGVLINWRRRIAVVETYARPPGARSAMPVPTWAAPNVHADAHKTAVTRGVTPHQF